MTPLETMLRKMISGSSVELSQDERERLYHCFVELFDDPDVERSEAITKAIANAAIGYINSKNINASKRTIKRHLLKLKWMVAAFNNGWKPEDFEK